MEQYVYVGSFSENKEGKTPMDISKGLGHTEAIELVSSARL